MSSLTPPSAVQPPPTSFADTIANHPLINTISGCIVQLQRHPMFTKQRLQSLRQSFLVTVGFLVLLYCLVHIQIVFFWLLKFLFHLLFKIISIIFWLPLKTVRLFIPKSIDYDILFPLLWLCSIASFYISKFSHENICRFYDQYLVQRYRFLHYEGAKREDIRRYLFIGTFIVLLLLQSLFILMPITLAIRHHHENPKLSPKPVIVTPTVTVTTTTDKSPVKDVGESMSEHLYKRFIDAFTDENETHVDKKRTPLVSDEQLEDTFQSIQKTIKNGVKNLKSNDKTKEVNEEKKSSRFQRWIMHYLKAPFQKWESKKPEIINSVDEKNKLYGNEEEEDVQINSSSSLTDTEEIDHDDEDDDLSESDDDDDDDDDDYDEDEDITMTERIRQGLDTVKNLGNKIKDNVKNKLSSSTKDDQDEEDPSSIKQRLTNSVTNVEEELSSSIASDDEDSDDDDDDEATTDKIKEQLGKPIEKVKTIAQAVVDKFEKKLHSSLDDNDEDEDSGYDSDVEEEQSSRPADRIKETLSESIEKVKNVASNIKDKVISTLDQNDQTSTPIIDQIREGLDKPIQTVKEFGEQVLANVKETEEDHPSLLDRTKDNFLKPIETAATNLREKLSSVTKEEELSLINRAEKVVTPIKDKIVSNADELKHKVGDLLDSAEEFAENVVDKSSKFIKKKTKEVKKVLPKTDEVISKIKRDVVQPIGSKASKVKKQLEKTTEELKTTVGDKIKSLKKEKKPKTLTEKAKDKFKSISDSIQEKLPDNENRKKELEAEAKLIRYNELKLQWKKKINGWFDEAWNVWHLTKTSLAHIFISSTKHARHLPRYNTTSLYTAYTDVKCYDYTKKLNRYRVGKRQYINFLDTYRRHSPFPVYLSILKSNGPKCYRRYPDSFCGLVSKIPVRNFKVKLYRFIRFWALIGLFGIILSVIYKYFLTSKTPTSSPRFRRHDDNNRSSERKQETTISPQYDQSKTTTTTTATTQKTSSVNQNNASSNTNTQPLDVEIAKQLHLWLEREQNDGFRHLSETCRLAINNTFLKQLARAFVCFLEALSTHNIEGDFFFFYDTLLFSSSPSSVAFYILNDKIRSKTLGKMRENADRRQLDDDEDDD
ncbi:hypothetical protein I4U23_030603 [Adineta vaga]|nr:hypothetical protein I4U23_030603 [Adineta vaga]